MNNAAAHAKLRDIQKVLAKFAKLYKVNGDVIKEAAPKLSAKAVELFDSQTSVNGDPWSAQYTKKNGEGPTLNASGELRASVVTYKPSASSAGGSFANHGRYHRPPMFIPGTRSVPSELLPVMKDAAEKVIGEYLAELGK